MNRQPTRPEPGSWPKRYARYILAANRRNPVLRSLARASAAYLNRVDNLNHDLHFNGERFVLRCMARHGATRLFDVGASVGEWTLIAHSIVPDAHVDCFEILPEIAKVLEQRVGSLGNVEVHDFGLSDARGKVALTTFEANSELTTMTEYLPDIAPTSAWGEVVRGDDFLTEHAIRRVDLVKLDVEGAEDRVLSGFRRSFAEGRIGAVQFEYGRANIVTKFLLRDFHQFFSKFDFVVGKIFPTYVDFRPYVWEDEDFRGPNYIAVQRGSAALIDSLMGL